MTTGPRVEHPGCDSGQPLHFSEHQCRGLFDVSNELDRLVRMRCDSTYGEPDTRSAHGKLCPSVMRPGGHPALEPDS